MEQSLFRQILNENKKEYKFTIKVACDGIEDAELDKLEDRLECFELKSATEFKKTPLQKNPLDFPNARNTSVHISDIVVNYPATIEQIRSKVSEALGISEAFVAVYNEGDPRKEYTDQKLEFESEEYKNNYEPRIGTFPEDDKKKPPYGEEVIEEFLDDLNKKAKERDVYVVQNNLSDIQVVTKETHAGEEKGKPSTDSLFGRTRD